LEIFDELIPEFHCLHPFWGFFFSVAAKDSIFRSWCFFRGKESEKAGNRKLDQPQIQSPVTKPS